MSRLARAMLVAESGHEPDGLGKQYRSKQRLAVGCGQGSSSQELHERHVWLESG